MNIVVGYLKSWLSQIRYWLSNVGRIIHWLPYIWKDRDWDYGYLLRLMRVKLARMEKEIRERGHHLNHIKDADNIHFAVLLLDRILADDYGMADYEAYNKKWGKIVWERDPECDNLVQMRHANVTPENKAEAEEELRQMFKKAEYLQEQDWATLWRHIGKNCRKWWD